MTLKLVALVAAVMTAMLLLPGVTSADEPDAPASEPDATATHGSHCVTHQGNPYIHICV